MAKHEFGIMNYDPINERYDNYEPDKYCLVPIEDNYIDEIIEDFSDILCYWHCLNRPEKNIAYSGITLIPPRSLPSFIAVF